MREDIYKELIEVAWAHEFTNYTKIGALVGLQPYDSDLWAMLDDINRFEHENKRPLISALVVVQGKDEPGPGFWACAVRLGEFTWGGDKNRFWSEQLNSVWDYWASH
ncbi:hypothetical protein ES703_12713 [subsurface metagenome]